MGMLVLARSVDQSIVIHIPPSSEAREIRVMVCDVRSGAVMLTKGRTRIGIEAPKDCLVLRSELLQKDEQ